MFALYGIFNVSSVGALVYDRYDVQALLSHAEVITHATHVRSTLLQTSLRMVKLHGNYERWLAHVDPLHRDTIVESVAPSWLPIEVGLAHYQACDQLALSDTELDRIGQSVGAQLQSTLLSVAANVVRSAGATPEVVASCFGRLWPRLCQGGSLQLSKQGPKDLTIDLRAAVLSRSRYFRCTFVGNVRAGLNLLKLRALYIKMLPYDQKNDHFTVNVSYV